MGLSFPPCIINADQARDVKTLSVYPCMAAWSRRVVIQLASRSRRSLLQGSRSHASRAFRSRTAFRAGLCCNRREQMSMWPFSAACGERGLNQKPHPTGSCFLAPLLQISWKWKCWLLEQISLLATQPHWLTHGRVEYSGAAVVASLCSLLSDLILCQGCTLKTSTEPWVSKYLFQTSRSPIGCQAPWAQETSDTVPALWKLPDEQRKMDQKKTLMKWR